MSYEEFVSMVSEMRSAQQRYFQTGDLYDMVNADDLELSIRMEIFRSLEYARKLTLQNKGMAHT